MASRALLFAFCFRQTRPLGILCWLRDFGLLKHSYFDADVPHSEEVKRAMALGLWPMICATTPVGHSTHLASVPKLRRKACKLRCGRPAALGARQAGQFLAADPGQQEPLQVGSNHRISNLAHEFEAGRQLLTLHAVGLFGLGAGNAIFCHAGADSFQIHSGAIFDSNIERLWGPLATR